MSNQEEIAAIVRRRSAWHEAGHAVGAAAVGVDWQFIALLPQGDWAGMTRLNAAIAQASDPLIMSVIDLAGPLAEAWHEEGVPQPLDAATEHAIDHLSNLVCDWGDEDGSDAQHVLNRAMSMRRTWRGRDNLIRRWARKTAAAIWPRWADVQALAERLDRDGFVENSAPTKPANFISAFKG